jgi:hypothetical protein
MAVTMHVKRPRQSALPDDFAFWYPATPKQATEINSTLHRMTDAMDGLRMVRSG